MPICRIDKSHLTTMYIPQLAEQVNLEWKAAGAS